MSHSKIISGIDIGTSKITTIIGQYHPQDKHINIIAVSSTPTTGFRKGQIIDLDQAAKNLTSNIESAERMAGFQIKEAAIAINAPHIESINSNGIIATTNPEGDINHDDIARAIEASQAVSLPADKEIIHVVPRSYTVDGQDGILDPVGMNGIRLELQSHLVLASTSAIKNIRKCLDEVGIDITHLLYSGLVTAESSLTPTEKELGVALVDIGGSTTNITIFIENSPAYSAVIPVGAGNVTNDLAIGLRLSLDDTEKLKIQLSKIADNKNFEDEIDLKEIGIENLNNKKISYQTAVNGILKPRLEEIFTLVQQQLINSTLFNSIPAGIVLTGGGSLTLATREVCSKIIPLPQRIAYPPKITGVVDDIISPAYTTAIGLILYQLNQQPLSHQSRRKKVSFNGFFDKFKNLLEPLLP